MELERTTLAQVADVSRDVAVVKNDISAIKETLKNLVTRPEFKPVQLLTYTLAGSTLTGIIAAWLSQFFAKH